MIRPEISAAFGVIRMVYPSFLALTTLSVPIAIPPPGRLIGTTATLRSLASASAMVRPATSVPSPGASGITSVMGLLG